MKYRALLILLIFVAFSCASGSSANAPPLQLQLQQTSSSSDMYYFRGAIPVQYVLQIANPTNQAYTLRRINLQSTGPGAYSLRTGDSPINFAVPPNATVSVPLTAWAYSRGGFLTSTEPVNIRGLAYFDGAGGTFLRQFTTYLPQ
jgi:hypothetical protein